MGYIAELRKKHNSGLSVDNDNFEVKTGYIAKLRENRDKTTVDDNYIQSFLEDSGKFFNNATTDFGSTTYGNASSNYEKYRTEWSGLNDRANTIRNFLVSNKNNLSEDYYNSFTDYLNNFDKSSEQILSGYSQNNDFYKQFKTEDDYNKYSIGWLDDSKTSAENSESRLDYYNKIKARMDDIDKYWNYQKAYSANSDEAVEGNVPEFGYYDGTEFDSKDSEELQEEYDLLKQQATLYERQQKPLDERYGLTAKEDFSLPMVTNPDFYGDVEWGSYADKDGKIFNKLGYYLDYKNSEDVTDTDVDNDVEENYNSSESTFVLEQGKADNWDKLTEDEIRIYDYIAATESYEAANDWLDSMTVILNKRAVDEEAEEFSKAGVLEKIGWNIASIPMSVIGKPIAFIDDAIKTVTGQERNPYSHSHMFQNYANAIRESTANDINEFAGNSSLLGITWGDVYQSGMSLGDMAVGSLLGPYGYGAAMGMGAAADRAQELYKQGASETEINAGSILAGAAEMIFEAISLDKLVHLKNPEHIWQVLKNALSQGLVEGSEEVSTEIANIFTDTIVRGNTSGWAQNVRKYQEAGYDETTANQKAFADSALDVWKAGVGGFLSGGVAGGGKSAVQYVSNKIQLKQEGLKIIQNGDVQATIDYATELLNDEQSGLTKKQAEQLQKAIDNAKNNGNAKSLGALQEAVLDTLSDLSKTRIESALKEQGFNNEDVKRISEYLNNASFGVELTQKQQSEIENNPKLAQIYNSIMGTDIQVQESVHDETVQNASKQSEQTSSGTSVNTSIKDNAIAEKTSESGKQELISTGEEIHIENIKTVTKNGELRLTLSNGQVVSNKDISYASNDEALLYETVAKSGYDAGTANQIIQGYESVKNDIGVAEYLNGVQEGYNYGTIGMPEFLRTSTAYNSLSKPLQEFAYNLGEKAQNSVQANSVSNTSTISTSGKVHDLTNGRINSKNLTAQQKSGIELAKALAKVYGNDIYVYESALNANGQYVYTQDVHNFKAGQKAQNGFIVDSTGKIYIDLNAGNHGEGTMAYTLAHEYTHLIRNSSIQEYNKLAGFFLRKYGELYPNGYINESVDALIRKEMNKAEKSGNRLSYSDAFEEVIADAMSEQFTKERFAETVRQLEKVDKGLVEKLKELLNKLINAVRSVADVYKQFAPTSESANYVREFSQEAQDELTDLFAEAFVEGGKAFRSQKNTANGSSGSVKMSVRQNSKGEYVEADRQVITSTDPKIQEREIIDYVNNVVRNGQDVVIPLDNGEEIKITARTAWKLGDKGNYSDELYLVKGNAAGVIDEVIQTSQYKNTKLPLKQHRNGFAVNGFDYRVAYFMDLDGKYYRLTLSVGLNADGKEAYNIGKIEKIPFPDKSVSGSKANGMISSNTTITQNAQGVNSNSMQNGENNSEKFSSRYYDDIDVDEFDIKDYTKLKLTKRDHKVFYSEAITWDADKVGQICKKNLGAYTYVYSVNSDHTLTLLGKHKYTNIHERGKIYDEYKPNRKKNDRNAERYGGGQRNSDDSLFISNDRTASRTNDKLSNQTTRTERRSNGTGYTESGNNADSREEDGEVKTQTRNTDGLDNRTLLANALETVAKNDVERDYLTRYKNYAAEINEKQKQLGEYRRQIKELSFAKGKRDTDTITKLKNRADILEAQINRADKRLLNFESTEALKKVLEREKKAAYKKAKAEGEKVLNEYRQRQKAKQEEIITKYQQSRKKGIESRHKTELRHKIKKIVDNFNAKLNHPTEGRYIPKDLVKPVAEILSAINLDTGRSERLSEKLAALKIKYDSYKNNPTYSVVYDEVISEMIQTLTEDVGDTSIADMSLDQLEAVHNVLSALSKTVTEATKIKGIETDKNCFELSKEMEKETREAQTIPVNVLQKYLLSSLSADRAFETFGGFKKNSVWSDIYRLLDNGQLRQIQIQMETNQIFGDLLKDTKQLESLKKLTDIGLVDEDGNAVMIPRDMMLFIRRSITNEQNLRHLTYGGLTVPNIKEYYKLGKDAWGKGHKVLHGAGPELYGLTDDQKLNALEETENRWNEIAENIDKQLTEYEKQWLDKAGEFFDEYSKDLLNATTMEVYGFEKAHIKNYTPIHTDSNFRNATFESISKDMSLENVGFMKDRIVNASNPIMLEGLTDVINNQINNISKYCGMMPAIKEFQKIYGKSEAGFKSSLQDTMASKFGTDGKKYIENLLADLVGSRALPPTLFDRAKSNFAQAVLTLNPRVALAQAASYPTAAAVVGYKPLMKALAKGGKNGAVLSRADTELIAKYSPLLWYRSQGYSTVELGNIKDLNSVQNKLMKKARFFMGWIQAMDTATVGRLWYAAQYYVDENFDYEKGTDEYYQEVAKIFNRIVEETQPNYTTMQRPDILRNPDKLYKQMTMFMTQRLQNFNIMYESTARFNKYRKDFLYGKNEVTKQDVINARNEALRSVSSQVVAGVTIVAMKAIVDTLLHNLNGYRDDDKELTPESVTFKLLDNLLDTLFSNALGGSELYSTIMALIRHDNFEGFTLGGYQSFVDALITFVKTVNKPSFDNIHALAKKLCTFAGIPLENAEKIAKGIYYHIEDAVNGEFGSFEAGVNRTKSQNKNIIYKALISGDAVKIAKTQAVYADSEEWQKAVKEEVKEHFISGELSETQTNNYLTKYCPDEEAYWLIDKWKYIKENGSEDGYSKYNNFHNAVQYGTDLRLTIKQYTDNGVNSKTLSAEITRYFKPIYTEMSNYERAGIKGYLLNAYEMLGYDRADKSKDIDKWVE